MQDTGYGCKKRKGCAGQQSRALLWQAARPGLTSSLRNDGPDTCVHLSGVAQRHSRMTQGKQTETRKRAQAVRSENAVASISMATIGRKASIGAIGATCMAAEMESLTR